VVGEHRFAWSVGHAHERSDGPHYTDCREVVRLRRDGEPGLLEIVFRAVDGHLVADGFPMHSGAVRHADGRTFNLNEPGVVRRLLDGAIADGWQADAPGRSEMDGWCLFDPAGG
jgi:hypothetical protein